MIAFEKIYLARSHAVREQPAPAQRSLREAMRIRQRVFPPDDWRIGGAKSALGDALTGLPRYDEAEGCLLEAQRVLKDLPGAQGQEAQATRARLAKLHEARGHPQSFRSLRRIAEKVSAGLD